MESMEEAYRKPPLRNSPRIAEFKNIAVLSKFYIVCEQFTLCEAPSLQSALFYMFSAYYIFNLEYPKQASNVFYFLQDYILSYPDSLKRPSTYLAVASDIKRNLCNWMSCFDSFIVTVTIYVLLVTIIEWVVITVLIQLL